MGSEPTAQAWEAWVLPLYDARRVGIIAELTGSQAKRAQSGVQRVRGCRQRYSTLNWTPESAIPPTITANRRSSMLMFHPQNWLA
jgi:hypothetical protein